jgi:hypothetical protein
LYDQGVITEEEFRSLRARLGGEIRKGLDLPDPRGPVSKARRPGEGDQETGIRGQ